ncbi:MAG: MFS transporter [Chryseolinea sp.]
MLKVSRHDLFEPRVIAPCVVMGLLGYSYGTTFTLIPDFGQYVSIQNKGLLFTYMTMAALAIRLIGGRASDYWGRKPVLQVCCVLVVGAMLTIAFSTTPLQLILGMSLYGLAHGTTSPTLIAWATDLSAAEYKGRGLASAYIFMEFGIGFGALVSGIIYGNDPSRFTLAFGICAAMAACALVYLFLKKEKKESV